MKRLCFPFVLLSILFFNCKKQVSCPYEQDIGLVELTDETATYLPERYFSPTEELKFISTEGDTSIFTLNKISYASFSPLPVTVPCEADPSQTTRLRFKAVTNYHSYYSNDSLSLLLINQVDRTENGYFDLLNIWLSKEGGPLTVYGQINIITDTRTVVNASQINNPVSYTFYPTINIGSKKFENVYGDSKPGNRMSDVYWQQYGGLIGYKDKEGIDWVLLQ